jgi:hypothetical protein
MIKTYHCIDEAVGYMPLMESGGLNPGSNVGIFVKLEYIDRAVPSRILGRGSRARLQGWAKRLPIPRAGGGV